MLLRLMQSKVAEHLPLVVRPLLLVRLNFEDNTASVRLTPTLQCHIELDSGRWEIHIVEALVARLRARGPGTG